MFGLQQINECKERQIASYVAQPANFRFKGMVRDLTEREKIAFASFDAVITTLRSLDPEIIDMERLKKIMAGSEMHIRQFDSAFEGI